MKTPDFRSPEAPLDLPPGEVHVFTFDLEPPELAPFRALLSSEERARADRFMFEIHRIRFTAAHAQKRQILSHVLGVPPQELAFSHGPRGKPELAGALEGWSFNLSHSHNRGLLALCRGARLGVDLEHHRPLTDMGAIARRNFSPREVLELYSLPEERRLLGFFNAWSRKEAYIKAIGEGLHCPLHSFDVALHPDRPAQLLSIDQDPQKAARWQMEAFFPAPGFSGALVVEGQGWQVHYWGWVGGP